MDGRQRHADVEKHAVSLRHVCKDEKTRFKPSQHAIKIYEVMDSLLTLKFQLSDNEIYERG